MFKLKGSINFKFISSVMFGVTLIVGGFFIFKTIQAESDLNLVTPENESITTPSIDSTVDTTLNSTPNIIPSDVVMDATGTVTENKIALTPTLIPLITPTSINTSAQLINAISTAIPGDTILINGTLGSATDFTLYEINKDNITIKGLNGNKIYGTFNLKGNGDTLDSLNIYSRGGGGDSLKNAVNVISNSVNIINSKFEMPNPAAVAAGGGVGNGVVIWPYGTSTPNLNITGNTFVGYEATVPGWSSTGLLIAENINLARFGMEDKNSISITIGDEKALAMSNTFIGNSYDYIRSDWHNFIGPNQGEWLYSKVSNTTGLEDAIEGSAEGSTILIGSDITTTSQINIVKAITVDGLSHKINASFIKTDNSNNSAITISSSNVIIKNLIIDGSAGGQIWPKQLHGINVFQSTNVSLDNVSILKFGGAGVVVNASKVTVNNINTSANIWGGINIDKGTEALPTILTILGKSIHSETGAAIWKDDNSNINVSVIDTNNQYVGFTYIHDTSITGTKYILAPISITKPATDIVLKDATLNGINGNYNVDGTSFWVSKSTFVTTSSNVPAGVYNTPNAGALTANAPFSVSLSSTGITLTPNTKYYFVAWSLLGGKWFPGEILNFTTTNIVPSTPTLISPADGIYRKTSDSNYSEWSPATDSLGIHYRYQSASDSSFTNIYYDSNNHQPLLTYSKIMNPGEPEGKYFWRVQACYTLSNCSAWSNSRVINIDNTTPTTPTNGTPNNSFENTNDFYFNWNASSDVSPLIYEFQSSASNKVDENGSLLGSWNSIINGNSEQNNLTLPKIHSTGAPDGTYYWQVRAIDSVKNTSPWSPIYKVTLDTLVPNVSITSPTLNQVIKDRIVKISGTATDANFNYYYCYITDTHGEVGVRDASCTTTWHAVDTNGLLGSITLPNDLADGNYTIYLNGHDKAGNINEVTQSFILDTTITTEPVIPTEVVNVSSNRSGSFQISQGGLLNTSEGGQVLGAEKFNFTLLSKKGSKGNEVVELQKFLNTAGHVSGNTDGIFGNMTKAAVIKFQIANNLKGDGVVGALTRAVLNK